MGSLPLSCKSRFAVEKGRDPKKPRYADKGLGWADSIRYLNKGANSRALLPRGSRRHSALLVISPPHL